MILSDCICGATPELTHGNFGDSLYRVTIQCNSCGLALPEIKALDGLPLDAVLRDQSRRWASLMKPKAQPHIDFQHLDITTEGRLFEIGSKCIPPPNTHSVRFYTQEGLEVSIKGLALIACSKGTTLQTQGGKKLAFITDTKITWISES